MPSTFPAHTLFQKSITWKNITSKAHPQSKTFLLGLWKAFRLAVQPMFVWGSEISVEKKSVKIAESIETPMVSTQKYLNK